MADNTCSIDGCDRKHYGRGYCSMHYWRWRRTGHPERASVIADPVERFWSKVNRQSDGECWPWTGHLLPDGYGVISIRRVNKRAHRVSYELAYGAIPEGMHVCHHCDNPPCVNPAHLFLGTNADNVADKTSKGRAASMPGSKNPSAILDEDTVRLILADAGTHAELGRKYGVSRSTISLLRRRKTWRDVSQ